MGIPVLTNTSSTSLKKFVQSSTLRRNILETFSEIGALCNNGREFNTDLLVRSLFRIATPSADEIETSAKKLKIPQDSPG